LVFVEHADELVWKRALLASYGISHSGAGSAGPGSGSRRHVAPLDLLLLRDGQTVRRRTSSLGNTQAKGKDGSITDATEGFNVFDDANLKALEERLALWERAVRTRPRR